MKKIDMAYTKAEQKKRNSPTACEGPGMSQKYPYGLCLNFDDAVLEKLGISKLPRVGGKVRIAATCEVTRVSSNQSTNGEKQRNIELQITKLGMDEAPESMEEAIEDGIEAAE